MKNKQKAFTLVELLVTVSILGIFVTFSVSLFVSAIKEQKRVLDKAYLLSQGSFAAEYVARALRMAQKDIDGICITPGFNYELTKAGQGIRFVNYREGVNCQEFYFEDNKIKVERLAVAQDLTPEGLSVDALYFDISGEDQGDGLQGKVTFTWEFSTGGVLPQNLKLQTTVSQRELDTDVRIQ